MTRCYIDTSALMKRYVAEIRSQDVETLVGQVDDLVLARLGIVEFRCALARRRRSGTLPARAERVAYRLFEEDVVRGEFDVLPMSDDRFMEALDLIASIDPVPLRTLDALHLAAARAASADGLATADRIMAEAGRQLGLEVAYFGAT